MSEHLDRWFDRLRAQPPPTPFVPAEEVRRRGQRRRYRQYGLVAVAVLATTGLAATGLGKLAGSPGTAPPPIAGPSTAADALTSPTGAPPVSEDDISTIDSQVDGGWFLTTADLGEGDWRQLAAMVLYLDGPPDWLWAVACPGFTPADHPSLALRRELALRSWGTGAGADAVETADAGSGRDWLSQDAFIRQKEGLRLVQAVDLFQSGGAHQHLADVRRVVEECDPSVWGDDPVSYQIVRTGFAGDESLLITEAWRDSVQLIAVVRVGEVVTTLRLYDSQADLNWLLELARVAAARLPRA